MRPEGCQETGQAGADTKVPRNLQISNPFWPPHRLTLFKSETYTLAMSNRRIFVAALSIAGGALASSGRVDAQAIQRAMYVSALTDAGAPIPGLGPSDFVVREDKMAREIL